MERTTDKEKEKDITYDANAACFREGITPKEVVNNYNNWARHGGYDKNMTGDKYGGPAITAQYTAKYIPEESRQSVRILDVGAGTGRLGEELASLGFTQLDALDPSEEMLNYAKKKNIYRSYMNCVISEEETPIQTDTYDAISMCGVMGEGHIPRSGLKELIRIVKPGGLIVNAMRKEYLSEATDYKDNKLISYMEELESRGMWTKLEEETVDGYFVRKSGKIFVHRVV